MKLKRWIEAARLRTLPLSLSGIIVGSFAAFKRGFWDTSIFVLAVLTTLFLQILSNYANDLGDSYKGADNEKRLGPIRGLQAGEITQKEMRTATIITTVLALSTAIPLVIIGTQAMHGSILWIYIILAFFCVAAAITYTLGKKAYGYRSLGDAMVFLFFGLVSVLGVYSLYTKTFDWSLIGFAVGIGTLSVAVLNLNNMRDYKNDKASNKITIAVRLGFLGAKIYHSLLIFISFLGVLFFLTINTWWLSCIALLPYIFLGIHLIKVWQTQNPQSLDSEMKKVALSTFGIAILFLISTL